MILNETHLNFGSVLKIIHKERHVKVISKMDSTITDSFLEANTLRLLKDVESFVLRRRFFYLITMDESRIYQYDPKSKEMSTDWKTAISQECPGAEGHAVCFWGDCRGVILTDYMQKG